MNLEPSGTVVSPDFRLFFFFFFFSSVKPFKNTVQWFKRAGFGFGARV